MQHDIDVHARSQDEVVIGHFDEGRQRACLGVEAGTEEEEAAFPAATGERRRRDRSPAADVHVAQVLLVEIRFRPQRRVVRDLEDRHAGAELHAIEGVAHLVHDDARCGRVEGDRPRRRLGRRQGVDLRGRHVPVGQTLAGRSEQRPRPLYRFRVGLVAFQARHVVHRGEEFARRGDQLRAVDLEERIARGDEFADVVHPGALDPAFELGVDRVDLLLVVRQYADGTDRDGQVAARHRRRAYGEILQELLADPHAVRVSLDICFADQSHAADRACAGCVANDIRVHAAGVDDCVGGVIGDRRLRCGVVGEPGKRWIEDE